MPKGKKKELKQFNNPEDDDCDYKVKLLMLGDSGVGKSSLLNRFTEDSFDPNFVITIGVDFKNKIVVSEKTGLRLKLNVWDTAGQERFRTIVPAYYRGADGVVLCYDVSDENSFMGVQSWYQQIKQECRDSVQVALVGNKVDLPPEMKKVPREEGMAFAQKEGLQFFETSAKDATNVVLVYTNIAECVAEARRAKGEMPASQKAKNISLGQAGGDKKAGMKCSIL